MSIWYNSTTGRLQTNAGGGLFAAERSALEDCCCCTCIPGNLPESVDAEIVIEFRIGAVLHEKQEIAGTIFQSAGLCRYTGSVARTIYDYTRSGVFCGTRSIGVTITLEYATTGGDCRWEYVTPYGAEAHREAAQPVGVWTPQPPVSGNFGFINGNSCDGSLPVDAATVEVASITVTEAAP